MHYLYGLVEKRKDYHKRVLSRINGQMPGRADENTPTFDEEKSATPLQNAPIHSLPVAIATFTDL